MQSGKVQLIFQSDDFGFCHASNLAHFRAFEEGILTTAELMVPPPWFGEAAEWCTKHPEFDVGVHLDLTCEWEPYRWRPVLPYDQVSSLLDEEGYFYPNSEKFLVSLPKVEEADEELRAQIQRALDKGVKPSHLSTHMDTAVRSPELRETVNKISVDYGIPLHTNLLRERRGERLRPIRNLTGVPVEEWEDVMCETLENLGPGLYFNVFHISMDTPEFRALSYVDKSLYDSPQSWTWVPRPKLCQLYTSLKIKNLITELGIELVNYRDLALRKEE